MTLRGKGPTLVGVLWFETILCMIVLALRIYTRTVIRRSTGWDDLLLIFTWVCTFLRHPWLLLLS